MRSKEKVIRVPVLSFIKSDAGVAWRDLGAGEEIKEEEATDLMADQIRSKIRSRSGQGSDPVRT